MKNFKISLLVLCLIGGYAAQAQNPYWALYPSKKLTLSNDAITALPGLPPSCSKANSKGLFDANGNLVFYVSSNQIYNKTGNLVFTIPGTPCAKGLHIVPVPNGGCGEYYVVYAKTIVPASYSQPAQDAYEVGAVRVTVDASQNITVSSSISKVTYIDVPFVINKHIETALSKESNGKRTLYVSLRRSSSSVFNTNQLVKIKLNNSGLTKDGGFRPAHNSPLLNTRTLEISPNQTYLAWIRLIGSAHHMEIMNIATGTITTINIPNAGLDSDIEFAANSDDVYVTTTQGILITSLSNPQSSTVIPGLISIYGGNIELGLNNKLYAASANNFLYTLTGTSLAQVGYYGSPALPEQVDGESIVYYPPNPLNILLMMTANGNTQADVTGGSGNYTYTWSGSFGVVATGQSVTLCEKGQHTLVVRDNASGCSASYSFTNYPSFACRSASTNIPVGKVGVYPNPATDYLKIQANIGEQIMQLEVVNPKGQVILKTDGNQTATQHLPVHSLKKGMYILNIVTDRSSSSTKFFIK